MATEEPKKDQQVQPFSQPNALQSAELAATAVSAAAKAAVESAYKMALQCPRNEADALQRIKAACRIPAFAAKAKYRKPVGKEKNEQGQWVQKYAIGPSIRFAEEVVRAWRNVLVQQTTIYDDDTKRIINLSSQDLEANVAYQKNLIIDKAVERSDAKGRIILSQRMNSYDRITYTVRATEDEMLTKESAWASKTMRVNSLRLIPQHIIDDAMAEVDAVIAKRITEDPNRERKALQDGFAKFGVMPTALEGFFKIPFAQFTAAQLLEAREMLTSIEDGHATWKDFLEGTTEGDRQDMSDASQVETKGKDVADQLAKVAGERQVDVVQKQAPQPEPKVEPKAAPTVDTGLLALIDNLERELVATPAGQKLYRQVLSTLKVKFSNNKQKPVDVLPAEQHEFYLQQLRNTLADMRSGKSA